MIGTLSTLLPAAIRVGIGRYNGEQNCAAFSAAEEETLVHDASMSFWANVAGLNVEACSLEAAAIEMDSKLRLRVSEQFRGVGTQ